MFARCMKTFLTLVLPLALLGAACGDDDDDGVAASAPDDAEPADGDEASGDAGEAAGSSSGGGDGTATLTLANGEELEFSIRCNLEPQVSADQEILFTITSYDEPYGFDATRFGEDAVMPDLTSIEVYDSETYEVVWQASSIIDDTDLVLEGTTVTGSGVFYEGEEVFGDGVQGELHATC